MRYHTYNSLLDAMLPSSPDAYSKVEGDQIYIGVPGAVLEEFEVTQSGDLLRVNFEPKEKNPFMEKRSWSYRMSRDGEVSATFKEGLLTLQVGSREPRKIAIAA